MILFYVNPTAGSGHAQKIWRTLEPHLQKHRIPYTTIIDTHPAHALSRLRLAHSLKPRALFVIGGDGTLSSAVNAVIGSLSDPQAIRSILASVPFALIPAGSGNDIARSLTLPKDPLTLFDHTYDALQNGSPVYFDIAWHTPDAASYKATYTHAEPSSSPTAVPSLQSLSLPRVAVGFMGIGFDGEVVYGLEGHHAEEHAHEMHVKRHLSKVDHRSDPLYAEYLAENRKDAHGIGRSKHNLTKKTMRRLAYTAGVFKTLLSFQPFDLNLMIDGDKHTFHEVWMAALLNVTHFGGGMRISPNSRFDDGLWDLIVVHNISKSAFLRTFPRVFLGSHLTHPAVFHRRGQSFTFTIIQQRKTVYAQQDGDLIALPHSVDILPRALPFLLPQTF